MNKVFATWIYSLSAVVFTLVIYSCGPGVLSKNTYSNGSGSPSVGSPFLRALQFTASNSAVTLNFPSSINAANAGPVTVEAWIRVDSVPAANGMIYQHQSGSFYPQLYVNSTMHLVGVMANGACGTAYTVTSVSTLTLGKHYHVAISNSTSTVYMYLNGVFDSSYAGTSPMTCTATTAIVGNDYTGASGFPGVIDEVRVTNLALYPNGTNFTPPTAPFPNDGTAVVLYHADNPMIPGSVAPGELPASTTVSVTGSVNSIASPFP